jgi:regulator of ribonuclease activity A
MTMIFATADLCDANEDLLANGTLHVLPPVFKSFGSKSRFYGQAATLKVFEDNALVRSTLESAGNGRVLVVDGGGSLRCALVGGNLAVLAQRNGWAGIVIYGCMRDAQEVGACDIGVRALALHPQRCAKKGAGETNCRVTVAGVPVRPADWIYADEDGVLVAQRQLLT